MTKISSPAAPLLVVAAALVDREGRVLMQQRPPGKSLAGLWEFPGGKVEQGETPEAALVRELAEELGLGIDQADLVPFTFATLPPTEKGRALILLLYIVRRWHGVPEAIEASALHWAPPSDLTHLPMPPADVPLVAALATHLG